MTQSTRVPETEGGFALLAVMGAIALMTAVAVGGYYLAMQSVADTDRNSKENSAFQVASSGMDRELASFYPASKTYPYTGAIQGGTYVVNVIPRGNFTYTISCTGTARGAAENVSMKFFYIPTLWEIQMEVANNPDQPFGSAAAWNGGATIIGPYYINGDMSANSNLVFQGGPLFVNGNFTPAGGTIFAPAPYTVYYAGVADDLASTDEVQGCPDLSLPWVDTGYLDAAMERAKTESADRVMGPPSSVANTEVATLGNAATYTGTKAAGASTYYKVIAPGGANPTHAALDAGVTNLTIGGTGSWGKLPAVPGGSPRDDFAYDDVNNILYVDGTVFVDGDVTIDEGMTYVGNGTLIANGDIVVNGYFVPRSSQLAGTPSLLSVGECVGLSAAGDVWLNDSPYTGLAFTNDTLYFRNKDTEFSGIMHANIIDAGNGAIKPTLNNSNFSITMLPNSMPGGVGDPRGGSYASRGMIQRGTWARK